VARDPREADVRRVLAVVALLTLSACTAGLERGAEAISSGIATPTANVSPRAASGASGTTAADGKPAIVVRTPVRGDEIVSPVQITGTAMVFEGTVSVAIVDAQGVPLASTFTTASCGSGCRGRYSVELAFIVERRQAATIQVFEVSAGGGNAINVASVPVTLAPGG
jgi:hypothetical protein